MKLMDACVVADRLSQQIAAAEEQVAALRKLWRQQVEVDIPALMREEGVTECEGSGLRVELKTELYASLAAKNKGPAIEWLKEHGYGALVRDTCIIDITDSAFHDDHDALREICADAGLDATITEDVNTSRVKGLIRELLESGENIPLDVFGAHQVRQARIKRVE